MLPVLGAFLMVVGAVGFFVAAVPSIVGWLMPPADPPEVLCCGDEAVAMAGGGYLCVWCDRELTGTRALPPQPPPTRDRGRTDSPGPG